MVLRMYVCVCVRKRERKSEGERNLLEFYKHSLLFFLFCYVYKSFNRRKRTGFINDVILQKVVNGNQIISIFLR